MYYEARTANPDFDLEDEPSLRAAIKAAYGDCHWVDIDAIVDQCYSGVITRDEVLRKYLNLVTASDDALIDPIAWEGCSTEFELQRGDRIVLGLDGGETDDATALVALRVSDSLFQPIAIWEKPDGPEGKHWSVDKEAVSDTVDWVFANYRVEGFLSDTAFWETYVHQWNEKYQVRLQVKATGKSHVAFDMRGNQKEITEMNMALVGAVENGMVKHTGHYGLGRHFKNAKRRNNKFGTSFGKASRDSQYKVDAYAAALLAFIARNRLVSANKQSKPKTAGRLTTMGGF
jgi:phage terminase large subunit-like protein